MILLLVAFLAGALTVLAPCTIALLPVIVGGTLAGGTNYRRALTVTAALGASVILFTLLLKASSLLINVPQEAWEIISGVLIIFLGATMLFPALWERVPWVGQVSRGGNRLVAQGYLKQDFLGDALIGASLGPIFTSCSPTYFLIIAAVLPVSIAAGFAYLLAYALGLSLALLAVALAGQRLMEGLGAAADPHGWVKRVVGLLFVLIGVAIALGYAQSFELSFANADLFDIGSLEQSLLNAAGVVNKLAPGEGYASSPSVGASATSSAARIAAEALVYPKVPEIAQPAGFINTNGAPVTMAGLAGKVVLIDFWDYSCINCEREIPYVEAWWQKYQSEGLVVVGVHTPEFSFEKLQSNVQAAVNSLGITYPVVLDNDYGTWNAFGNQYWPQIYLVDSDGFVVYSHSGEGDYPETEAAIQKALTERDANLGLPNTVSGGTVAPAGTVEVNGDELGSPETYFGSSRNEYLANGAQGVAGAQTLALPADIEGNGLYLGGAWDFMPEYAETSDTAHGAVEYQFTAKNVYMVATGNPSATFTVLLDGKPISAADAGADVSASGTVTVDQDKLYKLVALPDYGTHALELKLTGGTLDAYTFTFG